MPQRLIHRAVQFRQGEAPVAWLMFAYSFLAMTAYNVLKPISKSKFIVSFGADNLPYIQLAAGALIGLLMLIYTWAIARLQFLPAGWGVVADDLAAALAACATLHIGAWLWLQFGR